MARLLDCMRVCALAAMVHSSDYVCVVHLCHRKCNPFFLVSYSCCGRQCTICAPRALSRAFSLYFAFSIICPCCLPRFFVQLSAEFYKCTVTVCTVLFAVARTSTGKKCVSSFSSARLNSLLSARGWLFSIYHIFALHLICAAHRPCGTRLRRPTICTASAHDIRHTNRNKAKKSNAYRSR